MTDQELKDLVAATTRNVAALMADNKETDRQLRDLRDQIGGLGNKFGSFTEGLAYPSLYRILTEDFHLDTVAYRVRQRRNGTEQEFDMLGSSNGANPRVFLVEIKSHLTETELQKFEQKLSDFFKFFPEHRGKALYGLIAAVDVARGLAARAARRGIYLALAHDGTFTLSLPAHFKAKNFS